MLRTLLFACFMAFAMCGVVSTVYADHLPAYDESAYSVYLMESMKDLDKLYLRVIDEKTPQGEAEIAKQEYLKTARHILQHANDRLDNLNVKEGASLSHTEVLLHLHIMTMMMDMLAGEHQPHDDQWSYTQ